ncbi:hypothetical protein B296_00004035 [Ensete ventricosum]|uniref:Uncharacterized protein n=1 Tax=Ensete ventricosum TaxID=4639 RepID=A0A427B6R9_ENSVE|nr:hypothetical protein B296_00004035 [Ensete ventricosum]
MTLSKSPFVAGGSLSSKGTSASIGMLSSPGGLCRGPPRPPTAGTSLESTLERHWSSRTSPAQLGSLQRLLGLPSLRSSGIQVIPQALELGLQNLDPSMSLRLSTLGLYSLGSLIGLGLGSRYSDQVDLDLELSDISPKLVNYLGELINDPLGVMHPIDKPHGKMVVLQGYNVSNRAKRI